MVMIPDLDSTAHPIDELLRHAAWTRRLARSLVADDALADDVAQDVWLASSRRPPRATEPLKPWLRTVVRNRVFNLGRDSKRRQAREARAHTAEAAPPADSLLERLELHKLLVEAVGALAEPYRSIVLRRYFDGLSSAEIGAREHLPAGTIRGRLKTALELLRDALDRRTGGRDRWMLPLTNFADPATRAPAAPRFSPVGKFAVGASLALTVATAGWFLTGRAKQPERARVAQTGDAPSHAARLRADDVDDSASTFRGSSAAAVRPIADARLGSEESESSRAGAGLRPPDTLTGTVIVKQPFPLQRMGRVHDGRVAGVVVRIVKGLSGPFPIPSGEIQLALRASTLGPRVQVGRVGQSIVVENTDNASHSLLVRQGSVTLFNQTIAGGGRSPALAIPKALEVIRLECPENPSAAASVVPSDNPFHAVTGEDGRFVLADLPPGTYTLQAEDEILGTRTADITIPNALPSITFAFDVAVAEARDPNHPCTIATVGRGPVGKACAAGGRVEAKKLMKTIVKQARASGQNVACDGCHQNLDDFALVDGARARLDQLAAALGFR